MIGNHDTGNLGPIIEVAPPAARQILIEARYPGKQAEGPLWVDSGGSIVVLRTAAIGAKASPA